jgi:hypothetical protein
LLGAEAETRVLPNLNVVVLGSTLAPCGALPCLWAGVCGLRDDLSVYGQLPPFEEGNPLSLLVGHSSVRLIAVATHRKKFL